MFFLLRWPSNLFCFFTFVEITCGLPEVITNGNFTPWTDVYNFADTVTYECDVGFRIFTGTVTRKCGAGFTWNGEPPMCTSKYLCLLGKKLYS